MGEQARHLAAQVSRNLAIQLLSGDAPRDPERGRALLEEACRDGDPEACRVGKALDGSAAP